MALADGCMPTQTSDVPSPGKRIAVPSLGLPPARLDEVAEADAAPLAGRAGGRAPRAAKPADVGGASALSSTAANSPLS